jgi:hypothetical protein
LGVYRTAYLKGGLLLGTTEKGLPIGGLLYLFAFGFITSLIAGIYYLSDGIYLLITTDFKELTNEYGSFYSSFLEVSQIYAIVSLFIGLIIELTSLYLFVNKRKIFVPFFICSSYFLVFIIFISELLANIETYTFYTSTISSIVVTSLWSWYLLKSNRVKQTFITTRPIYIKLSPEEYETLTSSK